MPTHAFSVGEIAYPVADDLTEPRIDRTVNIESVQIRNKSEGAILCDTECGITVAGHLRVRMYADRPTRRLIASRARRSRCRADATISWSGNLGFIVAIISITTHQTRS